MVAPSFQGMKRVSEVYFKDGKHYVDMQNKKTGAIRAARWYADDEYTKAYGRKLSIDDSFDIRSFDNGPILVIRGNKANDEEWLCASIARYAIGIGWYITSTNILPEDAPKHFKYLLLGRKEAIIDEEHMKKPNDLNALLAEKARKREWIKIDS